MLALRAWRVTAASRETKARQAEENQQSASRNENQAWRSSISSTEKRSA